MMRRLASLGCSIAVFFVLLLGPPAFAWIVFGWDDTGLAFWWVIWGALILAVAASVVTYNAITDEGERG